VAIEPTPRAFALLAENVARNFPDRVTPVHAACDEADGTVTLFVSDYSAEFNSLRPDAVVDAGREEVVPARSLRSLSQELGMDPDVVKIDVEGAEWNVLRGLFDGNGASPPRALMVEACSTNTRGFGYRPSSMCGWLREQGYQLSIVQNGRRFEYSDGLADGPGVHDVLALRAK
jgi:FkbM family methyltransferase